MIRSAWELWKYSVAELARSRLLPTYVVFFFLATWALLHFQEDPAQTEASILSLVLLIVPLVGLVFGTARAYNSRDFMELVLTQPVRRTAIFCGTYFGFAIPMALGFALAVLVPFLIVRPPELHWATLAFVVLAGSALTGITSAMAMWISLIFEDRVRGLAFSVVLWIALTFVYDAVVLAAVMVLQDYPLEKPMLVVGLLNPLDLCRIAVLLQLDVSALLGYTGAVARRFFGARLGAAVAMGCLLAWWVVPLWRGWRRFLAKDF
jgi:Cu-processing system permease protein